MAIRMHDALLEHVDLQTLHTLQTGAMTVPRLTSNSLAALVTGTTTAAPAAAPTTVVARATAGTWGLLGIAVLTSVSIVSIEEAPNTVSPIPHTKR